MTRVAVTYDSANGEVFQHFGHTEEFKVYEIEDGKVLSSEVVGSNGAGHEALAGLLSDSGIDVLVCGGMGAGAQAALSEAGIVIYAGQKGQADDAIEAFLKGELVNSGVNCDHHDHHHEEETSGGCGSSCGSGCGSGCSGCHPAKPAFEGENVGKVLKAHYRGTFNDGTQFDSSYDRGEPLQFVCGAGQMILGFDKAVANMKVGEKVNVHLMPEEAYGPKDPEAIITLEIAQLPGSEELEVGDQAQLINTYGQPFIVLVVAKDDKTITFDANHEMAGKELNFEIELVEIM